MRVFFSFRFVSRFFFFVFKKKEIPPPRCTFLTFSSMSFWSSCIFETPTNCEGTCEGKAGAALAAGAAEGLAAAFVVGAFFTTGAFLASGFEIPPRDCPCRAREEEVLAPRLVAARGAMAGLKERDGKEKKAKKKTFTPTKRKKKK